MSYIFFPTRTMETYNSLIESLFYVDDDSDVGWVMVASMEVIGGLGSSVLAQAKMNAMLGNLVLLITLELNRLNWNESYI